MKRLGFRWAAGLFGAGAALGAACAIAMVDGASVADRQDEEPAAGMARAGVPDGCDDACLRGRGAAVLLMLSQRPPQ